MAMRHHNIDIDDPDYQSGKYISPIFGASQVI